MKKFLLSATLLVAFSLTSFANIKEEGNKAEPKKESKTKTVTTMKNQDLSDGCVTVTYRWADGESDGEGGMTLTFHKLEFTVCF